VIHVVGYAVIVPSHGIPEIPDDVHDVVERFSGVSVVPGNQLPFVVGFDGMIDQFFICLGGRNEKKTLIRMNLFVLLLK
jgi:hypothetical protein